MTLRTRSGFVISALMVMCPVLFAGQDDKEAKDATNVVSTGRFRGTVVTGIHTPGGDCSHRYWLRTDPVSTNGDTTLLALQPASRILAKYVNQRVEIEGETKACKGATVSFVVIVVQHIRPAS